jgi:hypothetical protein
MVFDSANQTFIKMKKKKLTASERSIKINEQRFAMIVLLCNVLDTESEDEVSNGIKSAISASLLNLIEMSFIPGDDEVFENLINNSIDGFCKRVEEERGIENYREQLLESVKSARVVLDHINQKIQRIREGEDILKGICLN